MEQKTTPKEEIWRNSLFLDGGKAGGMATNRLTHPASHPPTTAPRCGRLRPRPKARSQSHLTHTASHGGGGQAGGVALREPGLCQKARGGGAAVNPFGGVRGGGWGPSVATLVDTATSAEGTTAVCDPKGSPEKGEDLTVGRGVPPISMSIAIAISSTIAQPCPEPKSTCGGGQERARLWGEGGGPGFDKGQVGWVGPPYSPGGGHLNPGHPRDIEPWAGPTPA